jgi:hypothetical protein
LRQAKLEIDKAIESDTDLVLYTSKEKSSSILTVENEKKIKEEVKPSE